MQALDYFPHISRPRRFPDGPCLGQPSLLDHVWIYFTSPCSSESLYYNVSDNLPIFINIKQEQNLNINHKMTFRDFNTQYHNLIHHPFTNY